MDLSKILDQMIPAPDEAPLTVCPHCGQTYNTNEDDPEDFYDVVVEETPESFGIYRHKLCGGQVRMI